jgi:hypothetical protein
VIEVASGTRMVVVLGRGRSDVNPSAYVARAAERRLPLLVLAVGYPLSEQQQAFVAECIDRAFAGSVELDAQIVTRAAELGHHVAQTDEITIVAAGRDEHRIGSALAHLPS